MHRRPFEGRHLVSSPCFPKPVSFHHPASLNHPFVAVDGVEKGRYILHTKCCKAPGRDMKKDEGSLQTESQAQVHSSSPKRQGSQKASSSGTGKRKKKGAGAVLSSDSEVEKMSQNAGGKKMKGAAAEASSAPFGYCNLIVSPSCSRNFVLKLCIINFLHYIQLTVFTNWSRKYLS